MLKLVSSLGNREMNAAQLISSGFETLLLIIVQCFDAAQEQANHPIAAAAALADKRQHLHRQFAVKQHGLKQFLARHSKHFHRPINNAKIGVMVPVGKKPTSPRSSTASTTASVWHAPS